MVKKFKLVLEKCYTIKRLMDNRGITIQMKISFCVGFFLLPFSFWLFYYATHEELQYLKIMSYVFFTVSLILSITPYIIYFKNRVTVFPSFEQIVQKEISKFTRCLNETLVQRGLFWNVVPGYYWLELHIDRLVLRQDT